MAERFAVVVCGPEVDAVVGAALVGRAAQSRAEALVFDSQGLPAFFGELVQQKLPPSYDLVLCGLEVVQSDWDGRPVRALLVDALRGFMGPVRWFSARHWEPEDRVAVAHILGEGNLTVRETAGSVAAVVRDTCFGPGDEYANLMVRLATARLSKDEEDRWGAKARLVLTALKANYGELASAVGLLMEGRLQGLIDRYQEKAARVDEENHRFAREKAQEPRPMGEMRLVLLSLPASRQPFWAEIGAYARQERAAELSLCCLEGRSVMLLARGPAVRADLRDWARYVTDLLPAARSIGAEAGVVPLVVQGLTGDEGLREEVLSLLAEGAHLLRG